MIILAAVFAVLAFSAGFWLARPLLSVRRRWLAPVLSGLVVAASAAVYMIGGQPGMPGVSFAQAAAARQAADPTELSREARIESLRDRVRRDDGDADAWVLLGRELARAGRFLEAISAFQRALQLDPQARTFSDFGQTLMNLNDGDVTPDAYRAFEEARTLDPDLPEASFFLGLSAYQAGDRETAAEYWSGIVARLDRADPFRGEIARQAVDLLSRPNASADAIAAAEGSIVDPQARIAQMVAGLEARMAETPEDLSGWLVLARVKRMMEDGAGSENALAQAEANFQSDDGAMILINTARAMLGLDEEDDRETP